MRRSPVIIVQARMTSTRLPGKVMMLLGDRPMLGWQLDRLRRVRSDVRVAVATTVNDADDPIIDLCDAAGVPAVRGSEADVLDRYREAAEALDADPVIRVTSDCPLIDPDVTRRVLELWERDRPDYAANTLERTFPRGLDTEVVTRATLEETWREAREPFEREHVTPFIYARPGRFRLANLASAVNLGDRRWTVDTAADLEFVRAVYAALGPQAAQAGMAEVLELLARRPELEGINRDVAQKPLAG